MGTGQRTQSVVHIPRKINYKTHGSENVSGSKYLDYFALRGSSVRYLNPRLVLMGLLATLLIVMTLLSWMLTSANLEHSVSSIAMKFHSELLSHIEDNVKSVLQGKDASADSLAKFFGSFSRNNMSSFSYLQDEVLPVLFLIFGVLGKRVGTAFYSADGLMLAYSADSTGTYLTYANVSYLYPIYSQQKAFQMAEVPWKEDEDMTLTRPWYKWYCQMVDENTGMPIGEVFSVNPKPFWAIDTFNDTLHAQSTSASWGFSLTNPSEMSFTYLSPVKERDSENTVAVVSLGVSAFNVVSVLDQSNLYGGAIYITSSEGQLLVETEPGSLASQNRNNSQLSRLAAQSENAIVAGAAEYLSPYMNSILAMKNKSFTAVGVEIVGLQYVISSAPLEFSGSTLVCTVIVPYSSLWGLTHKSSHTVLAVLIAFCTCMAIIGCFLAILLFKGVSNEMWLRAALIRQLEETKNAEMKSSHKSLVFANMSHDLRTPLAAILGLVDLCLIDASEHSELGSNLVQIKSCATNLLGILNSILDMSKIEAGKLVLQESEFDLVSALEEVINTFHVVGLKKGVEVVMDLSDDFIENASWVVGDCGRVKQIIANLLSNGVKFTSKGYVILRAWVKPFDVSKNRHQYDCSGNFSVWPWSQCCRPSFSEKDSSKMIKGYTEQIQENNEYLEVQIEVDDSGRGIPKERWKSVFENFVQVESSEPRNYDGTGLGLGIVRSLVRLMRGEINIIDKDEPGEPGTRFRFNIIFNRSTKNVKTATEEGLRKNFSFQDPSSLQATFGVSIVDPITSSWHFNNTKVLALSHGLEITGANTCSIMEGVPVVLAMQGQAGMKIVSSWMERRGLQVWTVEDLEELGSTLDRIKLELLSESCTSSERMSYRSPNNQYYDTWVEDLEGRGSLMTRPSTDSYPGLHTLDYGGSSPQKLLLPGSRLQLLLILDAALAKESISALCLQLEELLLDIDQHFSLKIVWLVNTNTPSIDIQFLRRQTGVCNLILHKPLYASRLKRVWSLLQELVGVGDRVSFEGEVPHVPSGNCDMVNFSSANSLYNSLSCMSTFNQDSLSMRSSMERKVNNETNLADADRTSSTTISNNSVCLEDETERRGDCSDNPPESSGSGIDKRDVKSVSLRIVDNTISDREASKRAIGTMHVLVAEDNPILQRLAKTHLIRLGATVQCVDNGADAVRLVLESLYRNKSPSQDPESSPLQPFDLVLMDCEMPILNGYEATQRIRIEENRYGVRIPVIALTAHAMAQDEKKCIEAGMDYYLTKPLVIDALLDVVAKILSQTS